MNYMSTAIGQRIRPRDLRRISLREFLRDRLRITQPVLAVRLVVTDAAGSPVEVSDTFYRVDRYHEVQTRLPPARRGPDARDTRPCRPRTVRQP